MRSKLIPFLPIACLMLSGCAGSPRPLPRPMPPLESNLAEPCPRIPDPPAGSYDAWQDWMQGQVLQAYGLCAARHAAIVAAWPK